MSGSKTAQPGPPTLLALWKEEHGSTVSWLARRLGADRNYVYHLLDPLHPHYRYHAPSADILAGVARLVGVTADEVRRDLARAAKELAS